MPVQTEGNRLNDVLKYELENNHSREVVVVKSGKALVMGAVVGKIKTATPATGTAGTNTGGGSCTTVTGGPKTKVGEYKLTCIAVASGAGTFAVRDPDGKALPNATVGVAYVNDNINFTLNDGTPDFAVGDSFAITVAEGSGKVVEIDPVAVDGSNHAHGILIADYDAALADVDGVAIVRDAQIVADNLTWKTGMSAGQIAAALLELYDKGIVTREQA